MLKKRAIFLLIAVILLSSCTNSNCLIEKKEYSCQGFNVVDIIRQDENVTISEIEYLSEGLKIKGFMADPKGIGTFPLILFNHGGKQGIEEMNWIDKLADNGYIVLASQYRGEGGSEGKVEVALGETTDVLNLLECGKNFQKVDKERIGTIGFSHGGGITIEAMELSDDFKAGVEFWGPADIKKRFENIEGKDDPVFGWVQAVGDIGTGDQLDEELIKRSPIYCIYKISAPLLIFHGEIDKLIPIEYSEDLVRALKMVGKKHEFVRYDNIGHAFERLDGTKDLQIEAESMAKTIEWFDKYLK
ncbi:MAG: dienelactone hydrolase family protein [Nanoarchaeota archaeon]